MDFSIFSLSGLVLGLAFFFGGIIDAVSGGGGLLTLPAFLAVGFPVHFLMGTNQMTATFGGVTSFLRFAKRGKIYWKIAIFSIPTAILGAVLGARINMLMPERYLQIIMLVLIPIVAVIVLFKRDFGNEDHSGSLSQNQLIVRAMIIGLICGAYQGFYGAGSGVFFLLSYSVLTRLDLVKASGCTKFTTTLSCLSGAITYALSGGVLWSAVIPLLFCNIAGNYIGSGLAMTKGAKVIRPMFISILCLLVVKLVYDLLLK